MLVVRTATPVGHGRKAFRLLRRIPPPTTRIVLFVCWCLAVAFLYRPLPPDVRLGIVMESSEDGVIELFVDDGGGFRQERSVSETVYASSGRFNYDLVIPAQEIHALRVDPINKKSRVVIESIEVVYESTRLKFAERELALWKPSLSLVRSEKDGRDGLRLLPLVAQDDDPQLVYHFPTRLEASSRSVPESGKVFRMLAMLVLGGILIFSHFPQATEIRKNSDWLLVDIAYLVVPAAFLWVFYHPILGNWFLADDPCYLEYFKYSSIVPTFFLPDQSSSPVNFTPMFNLSFGVDYRLFALEPRFYYLHHLLSLSVTIIALGLVLRPYLPSLLSCLILWTFLLTFPVMEAANYLMERHYIEGLGWSALSILCACKAARKRSWKFASLGGAIFLIACLSKEIYVPLVCLLPFLCRRAGGANRVVMLPFLVATVVYAGWRWHMLGGVHLLSGYSTERGLVEKLASVSELPTKMLDLMKVNDIHQALVCLGLGLFLLLASRSLEKRMVPSLAWAAVLVLPIIPVAHMMASRYVFLSALMVYVALGMASAWVFRTIPQVLTVFFWLLLLGSGVASFETNAKAFAVEAKRSAVGGRFLAQKEKSNAVLIEPRSHCLASYQILNLVGNGKANSPGVAASHCNALLLHPHANEFYIVGNGKLLPHSDAMPTVDQCPSERVEDLHVAASYHPVEDLATWTFSPYQENQGEYFVSVENRNYVKMIAPRGICKLRLDMPLPFSFNVMYVDRQGWWTRSPLLNFPEGALRDTQELTIHWRRDDD